MFVVLNSCVISVYNKAFDWLYYTGSIMLYLRGVLKDYKDLRIIQGIWNLAFQKSVHLKKESGKLICQLDYVLVLGLFCGLKDNSAEAVPESAKSKASFQSNRWEFTVTVAMVESHGLTEE